MPATKTYTKARVVVSKKPGYVPNKPAPAKRPIWDCYCDDEKVLRTRGPGDDPPQSFGQYTLIDFDREACRANYRREPEQPDTNPEGSANGPDTQPGSGEPDVDETLDLE